MKLLLSVIDIAFRLYLFIRGREVSPKNDFVVCRTKVFILIIVGSGDPEQPSPILVFLMSSTLTDKTCMYCTSTKDFRENTILRIKNVMHIIVVAVDFSIFLYVENCFN